jgi:WLM domain
MNSSTILVSFRGEKLEIPFHGEDHDINEQGEMLGPNSSVFDLRALIAERSVEALLPSEVKLIYKGKILNDDAVTLSSILHGGKGNATTAASGHQTFRFMASGVSKTESNVMAQEFQQGIQNAKRLVRDDLTEEGQRRIHQRQLQGQRMLQKAILEAQRSAQTHDTSSQYGFDRIETLPNLPDEAKAREILTTLANDPGVKACMSKHKWKVGSLAELYPEGNVGETDVCVMGLNKNKGAQILLRIRTDDLKGFRKILSIREVLYHELAHNVHSEHDSKFFQLMRQIKKECLEMDWTQGHGLSQGTPNAKFHSGVVGGSHRLGGDDYSLNREGLSARELARRAAIRRLAGSQDLHGPASSQCLDCRNEKGQHENAFSKNDSTRNSKMDEL